MRLPFQYLDPPGRNLPVIRLSEGPPVLPNHPGEGPADASQQDYALMQRVASGEERAVRELYERFGALVYKTARQILPARSESDDAVQEVFVRLWQTADRYDPQRAKLVTWVMLIARRHLIDRLRRNLANPNPATLEDDWSEASSGPAGRPDRQPINNERNVKLRERISTLPKLQRMVIERAYLQGFTLREVSEQLEAPLGTIKSALSRGLAKLREDIQADQTIR